MGGKVVMDLALTRPEYVDRMVVVDIAPVRYSHDQWTLINAMRALDTRNVSSRAEAERLLAGEIEHAPTRLFLLQNLVPSEGGYRWRLNLPVIAAHHDDIMGFPDHDGAVFNGRVLVLNGDRSEYVTAAHRAAFQSCFPAAEFETIAGAGHWVHADRPRQVCDAVVRFLSEHP
jgi:pimeloyl-ACP methyl ester carboxylesterase